MSAIGEAFRTKLLSYATVSAIVGQRMYPDALVQRATLPAIIYYTISTQREHSIAGLQKLAHARIQLDCYATTRTAASALSKAIRETGIDAYRGVTSSHTFCGVEFDSGDEYLQEPPDDGNQEHRYIVSFDCLVHYKEP
jgi:hypothetical protein